MQVAREICVYVNINGPTLGPWAYAACRGGREQHEGAHGTHLAKGRAGRPLSGNVSPCHDNSARRPPALLVASHSLLRQGRQLRPPTSSHNSVAEGAHHRRRVVPLVLRAVRLDNRTAMSSTSTAATIPTVPVELALPVRRLRIWRHRPRSSMSINGATPAKRCVLGVGTTRTRRDLDANGKIFRRTRRVSITVRWIKPDVLAQLRGSAAPAGRAALPHSAAPPLLRQQTPPARASTPPSPAPRVGAAGSAPARSATPGGGTGGGKPPRPPPTPPSARPPRPPQVIPRKLWPLALDQEETNARDKVMSNVSLVPWDISGECATERGRSRRAPPLHEISHSYGGCLLQIGDKNLPIAPNDSIKSAGVRSWHASIAPGIAASPHAVAYSYKIHDRDKCSLIHTKCAALGKAGSTGRGSILEMEESFGRILSLWAQQCDETANSDAQTQQMLLRLEFPSRDVQIPTKGIELDPPRESIILLGLHRAILRLPLPTADMILRIPTPRIHVCVGDSASWARSVSVGCPDAERVGLPMLPPAGVAAAEPACAADPLDDGSDPGSDSDRNDAPPAFLTEDILPRAGL
eukprot:gene46153-biopygen25750